MTRSQIVDVQGIKSYKCCWSFIEDVAKKMPQSAPPADAGNIVSNDEVESELADVPMEKTEPLEQQVENFINGVLMN